MRMISQSTKLLKAGSHQQKELLNLKTLPLKAQEYINFIEDFVGCNISIVSTGPSRDQTIHR